MHERMHKQIRNYKNIVKQITFMIDLNYVLAEAQKEGYRVALDSGQIQKQGFYNQIKWSGDDFLLSLNYDISHGLLYNYIVNNQDKVIKMTVDLGTFYPIHREIIIYVPQEVSVAHLKKFFHNIVDVQYDCNDDLF